MKRVSFLLVFLTAIVWLAAQQKAPRFEPPEVVATANVVYPIHSVAWGTVIVEAAISPSGAVEDVRVVKDIPSLTGEAVRSVKAWRFKPARLDGRPVRSIVPVAVVFDRGTFQPGD